MQRTLAKQSFVRKRFVPFPILLPSRFQKRAFSNDTLEEAKSNLHYDSSKQIEKVTPVPQLPILLVHGFLGFDFLGPIPYWVGIPADLENQGCKVALVRTNPIQGIDKRAALLKEKVEQVKKEFNAPKVHLIGHSMGGLDSRYFISKLGGAKDVMSLVTIATPHRGSPLADWVMTWPLYPFITSRGIVIDALLQLTPKYLVKDDPSVAYFSLAGGTPLRGNLLLYPFHSKLKQLEGENDGMVSTTSSQWGTFLGTLNEDHLAQINWTFKQDARYYFRFIASVLGSVERDNK